MAVSRDQTHHRPRGLVHTRHDKSQPLTALIVYVHSDDCVNLVAFDQQGIAQNHCSVALLQDYDPSQDRLQAHFREHGYYAEWMPYQKGQAAKTEKLEQQLATGVP